MGNIYNYVDKNKDKTFYEKGWNDVENLIFSSLPYLNFEGIVSSDSHIISLEDAANIYLEKNKYFEVSKKGTAPRGTYKLLKKIYKMKRYRNIKISNYIYIADKDKQFCAMKFHLPNNFTFISFEGTDNLLSGWKEDFELAYKFPIESQKYAIKYLNKNIHFFDKNVIVGGHSKGGNLALVASMYAHFWIKKRIKKIYNNDGPGLRKNEFESINYKLIEDKFIHIIPNYSVIGLLLRQNDNYQVVKSYHHNLFAHSLFTWQIKDDKFVKTELSKVSKKLDKSIILWLEEHDDEKREKMISTVFKTLEDSNIYLINDFISIKNAINVVKNIKNIDQETKELIIDFFNFNFNYLIGKNEIK